MTFLNLSILADAATVLHVGATTPAFVFLYLGPEIILPVASFVASIVGILLMFWRYVTKTVRKLFRRVFMRKKDLAETADLSTSAEDVDAETTAAPNVEVADAEPVSVNVER